jgi:hypothetical protein
MRTLNVSEFVTLDGVMEAPGGEKSHPHNGWVITMAQRNARFPLRPGLDPLAPPRPRRRRSRNG